MVNTHIHTPWRKSILIPFWVLQLGLSLFMIGTYALALGLVARYNSDDDSEIDINGQTFDYDTVETAAVAVAGVWLGLNCFCLILVIVEIVLLARHKLKPLTFVIMNAIKTAIWAAIFIIGIVGVAQRSGDRAAVSAVSLIIEAVLLLCFLIPLIYGSIIYHRFRKNGGAYKAVDLTHPVGDLGETAYPSQYTPFVQDHDMEAGRRVPGARRLSYNHTKDTRFESYRQASYGEPSPLETTVISNNPHVPNILVEHHGESYEMDNNHRTTLR